MNLITEAIAEMQRQDRVNDIDLSGVVEILHEANKAYNKALTIPDVVVQSEQLACDICGGSGFRWSPYYAKEVVCDCKR